MFGIPERQIITRHDTLAREAPVHPDRARGPAQKRGQLLAAQSVSVWETGGVGRVRRIGSRQVALEHTGIAEQCPARSHPARRLSVETRGHFYPLDSIARMGLPNMKQPVNL
jgi:hypothetical protein